MDLLLITNIFTAALVLSVATIIYSTKLKSHKKIQAKHSQNQEEQISEELPQDMKEFAEQEKQKREVLEQEIDKLQKVLDNTTTIAQEASSVKMEFLSNIRHEIRTPLNSILVFSETLKKSLSDKKLQSYADNVYKSGHKLLQLLNNIIELSEIESGKFDIDKSALDMRQFVSVFKNTYQRKAMNQGLRFDIRIAEKLPDSLMLDKDRISEILENLLDNALKFTQEGFITLEVKLLNHDVAHNSVDIAFVVKDSGKGISSQNQEAIFEIFEKGKNINAVEFQGTGLGLSINRKLARMMDGDLTVKSLVGKGSEFTLALGSVEVVLSHKYNDVDESKIDFSLIAPNGAKVVVIDHDEENLSLVQESFENTSVELLSFNTARDAFAAMRGKKIDLVLIDLDMLSIDDGAVAKVLKMTTDAPVVTLTSGSLKDITFDRSGVKPIDHIYKPVQKVDLFKIALKVLNSQDLHISQEGKVQVQENIQDSTELDTKVLRAFMLEQTKIQPLYQKASEANDLNATTEFAKALQTLAQKYKIEEMEGYAGELLEKVELFDIEALQILIPEFQAKRLKIQKHINT